MELGPSLSEGRVSIDEHDKPLPLGASGPLIAKHTNCRRAAMPHRRSPTSAMKPAAQDPGVPLAPEAAITAAFVRSRKPVLSTQSVARATLDRSPLPSVSFGRAPGYERRMLELFRVAHEGLRKFTV